ncbi:MAG: hypothetical protein EOM59_14450 [Clostridia bacterium]|nr:hypothetical protein [Clostridia bacterium]
MNKILLNTLCLGAVVFWASSGYAVDQTLKVRGIAGRVLCAMQNVQGVEWDGGIIPAGGWLCGRVDYYPLHFSGTYKYCGYCPNPGTYEGCVTKSRSCCNEVNCMGGVPPYHVAAN